MFIFTIAICNLYLYRKEPSRLYMVRLLRFTRRKCKHRCYGNGPPPAVTSLVTVARITVRSSPSPNVHRGERRYHVKSGEVDPWYFEPSRECFQNIRI